MRRLAGGIACVAIIVLLQLSTVQAVTKPKDKQADISSVQQAAKKEVQSIINTIGRYDKLDKKMRWRDALIYCENKGQRLCTAQEYCPHGKGKKPAGGNQVGDSWAPTSDSNNEWIFIGNDAAKMCSTYSELNKGEYPSWGNSNQESDFKGNLLCCPMKLRVMNTSSPTWDQVLDYCQSQPKMRLCTKQEMCLQGEAHAPLGGVLYQSAWAAVFDDHNEWLAVGMSFPKRLLCKTFRQIAPDKVAEWGKKNEPIPRRGVAMCCPDEFFNFKGRIIYHNAKVFCEEKKMRLCNRAEYCPNGAGTPPRGGGRPGEAWAPVGDDKNEWVSIGMSHPNKMCKTHTEIMDKKPDWGEGTGTLGFVQCCPVIWHELKRNITHEQGAKFCKLRKERLCRLSELCKMGPSKDPRGGALVGTRWTPIFDRVNEWAFVGNNNPSQLCQAHTKLNNGNKPEWGLHGGHLGTVQCCPDDGSTPDPEPPAPKKKPKKKPAKPEPKPKPVVSIKANESAQVTSLPKPAPTFAKPPAALVAKKIETAMRSREDFNKKNKPNEEAEKLARNEAHRKAYEDKYWKLWRQRKRTGEHKAKNEYQDALFTVKKVMADALNKAHKVISEAKGKRYDSVKKTVQSPAEREKERVTAIFRQLPTTPRFHPEGYSIDLGGASEASSSSSSLSSGSEQSDLSEESSSSSSSSSQSTGAVSQMVEAKFKL